MQSPPVVTASPHTSYDLIVVDCLHTLVAPYIGLGGVLSAGGSGSGSGSGSGGGGGRVLISYQHTLSAHILATHIINTLYQHNLTPPQSTNLLIHPFNTFC